MKYSAPRGTKDILPSDAPLWQGIEAGCRGVFSLYNYQEIRTPIFESTELFTRSIGGTTDIVTKEMYEFKDKKGRSLCLRPEETAPVVRAALENNLIRPDLITKLYYIGPMFRYERPQKGRQRQFHQAGVEVFGSSDPLIDVEVINLNVDLLEKIGLTDLAVNINSVGCNKCKPAYQKAIKDSFKDNISKMCDDCKDRYQKNPLRILDCKEKGCQPFINKAPASVDYLCDECAPHFKQVVANLPNAKVNKRLVRGLDYYTKTTFEIVSSKLGAQNAVSGGGRYDTLVEEFGGKPTPAVGFALGMERVIEILKSKLQTANLKQGISLFIATIGDEAKKVGFDLLSQVREKGISSDMDYLGKSLKAQMKTANRIGAKYVYIVGEDEINKKSAILKAMESGEEREVPFNSIVEEIR